jgi:hypothetical protein
MHEIYHTYVSLRMKMNAHNFDSNCIMTIKVHMNSINSNFLEAQNITFLRAIIVMHYIWGNIVNYHIQI